MNILVISTVRYRSNGISNVIRNIYLNDTFKEDDISFLFPGDNDAAMVEELEQKGFKVYQFPRYEQGTLAYFRYVKKLVKKYNIELVHVHGNSHALIVELLASKMGGCKIRICHSHNTTCNNTVMHKVLAPFFNILCTERLACGEAAGRWMYGNKPFQIINNGINTEKFRFNEEDRIRIRKQYGITDNEIVIGHVGNLNIQKNQTVLLDVMSKLNNIEKFKLLLVGEGQKRAELEEKTLRLGLNNRVIFVGATEEVPAYLSAMDVIAMPSLYEGLPLSLIEEQANGLTCIVSDNITREVNKTGLIKFASLDDLSMWTNELECVQLDSDRTTTSRKAITRIIEAGYCIENEAAKTRAIYEKAIKSV